MPVLLMVTTLCFGWTFYTFTLVAGRGCPLDLALRPGERRATRVKASVLLATSPLFLIGIPSVGVVLN